MHRDDAIFCIGPEAGPNHPGEILVIGDNVAVGGELWDDPLVQFEVAAVLREQLLTMLNGQRAPQGVEVRLQLVKFTFTQDPTVALSTETDGCEECLASRAGILASLDAGNWAVICRFEYEELAVEP